MVNMIGKIIKENRIRKGISQEELCDGLCDVTTLSRLERCARDPSLKLAEAFMQKLGLSMPHYGMKASPVEFERAMIEEEALSRISKHNYEISDLIERYKFVGTKNEVNMSKLEEQFYEYMLINYDIHHGKEVNAEERYLEALRITFPNFSCDEDFSNHYFTEVELILINNIAIERRKVDLQSGIRVLRNLKKVFEKQAFDVSETARHYPAILANLTNWLFEAKEYEEAYQMAETGIDFCVKRGNFVILPDHLYDKGVLLILKGNKAEGRKLVLEGFFLMKLLKLEKMFKNALKNVNNVLGDDKISEEEIP